MTVTISLSPDVEAQLETEEAAFPDVREPEIKTGTDLLAHWEEIGFVGMCADREDTENSLELARRLRKQEGVRVVWHQGLKTPGSWAQTPGVLRTREREAIGALIFRLQDGWPQASQPGISNAGIVASLMSWN